MSVIQAMYAKPTCKVCINNGFSYSFSVDFGVHQGSVLIPLLFVIVLEALSRALQISCPWEMLYADDLVLVSELLDALLERLHMYLEGWTGVKRPPCKHEQDQDSVLRFKPWLFER